MKLMSKLLLINWHYFSCETIEFGQLNFLTGKNAHGKSTIIDALQVILLGDTSGSFFNKAAGGKGGRSLKGYLLGELRDAEGGGFHFLRGNDRFTSYITVEFFDTEKKKYFTAGYCFDVYSENDYLNVTRFIYNAPFPVDNFTRKNNRGENVPINSGELRNFLKESHKGHYEIPSSNRDFREKLCGKLGGLRVERFGNLLKKAVSFNPDVKIHDFISEFVCDEQQTVDVAPMQETIRSYKQLEGEAAILVDRIALLENIINTHGKYKTAAEKEKEYKFLIDRANIDAKRIELEKLETQGVIIFKEIEQLKQQIEEDKRKLKKLSDERDLLKVQLLSSETTLQLNELERQISEIQNNILQIQKDFNASLKTVCTIISGWDKHISEMIKTIENSGNTKNETISSRINDLPTIAKTFLDELTNYVALDAEKIMSLGSDGFTKLIKAADSLRTTSIQLCDRIKEELESLTNKNIELQREYKNLEQGINPFHQDVLDLKEAIVSRLRLKTGTEVKVNIVAEVSEIKNDRWRNVIEGYLNTQKYYIIVAAEHFREALSIYDKVKTTNKIYGTGIVDIEKIIKRNPSCNSNSLAAEIETTDANVRVFLDYVLGNVIKCDDVQELRKFHTSVTDEGMLYKGFVARAMNPKTWEKPAIGQEAIKRRLLSVKSEISALKTDTAVYEGLKRAIHNTSTLDISRATEFERVLFLASESERIPALEDDLTLLKQKRDEIDTTANNRLESRIDELTNTIDKLTKLLSDIGDENVASNIQLGVINSKIPQLKEELSSMLSSLNSNYDSEWMENTGIPRYERELSQRGAPEKISGIFPRELNTQMGRKDASWNDLCGLRREYNSTYKMGLPERTEDNSEFDKLWLELSENSLPSYTSRITDAKNKAIEQFQEDFLSRLQNNIKTAKRQIDDLNNALKGCSFGDDTYRFKIIANKTNERFYNMIMDEMYLMQGWNLMSGQFQEKYKEEISDLFSRVTNEDGAGGAIGDSDKRIMEYTDYRTYLEFDLEVSHKDGSSERLSKTLNKKSGGETQTPFYIAVLASFAQLYRIGRDKSEKTSRLIIFDEAFSKMDSERISRSIELLRKFNFQVILSAPSDKIAEIATLVDRNLLVYREGRRTCVRTFDPCQIEGLVYD